MTTPAPDTPITPLSTFKSVRNVEVDPGLTTRFGNTDLTDKEISERSGLMDEAMRASLAPKERFSFYYKAVQGLDTKFTLTDNLSDIDDASKSSNFMTKTLNFTLLLQEISEHIRSKAMDSVFKVLNIDPITNTLIDDTYVNLLKDHTSVSLEQVKRSVAYYRKRSLKMIDQENMQWSLEFLLNSCDDDLRRFLRSKMMTIDSKYHGGPTIYMILVQEIVHNNDNIARALTLRLENFKVTDVAGENIETVTSLLLAICDRLECCEKLPHDITKIILSIIDTCTISRFTNHFTTLYTMKSDILNDYKEILNEATRLYRELRTGPRNQWLPVTKSGSVYVGSLPVNIPSPGSPSNPLPTHDRKGQLIDRTPPKGSEPHTRSNGTSTEHWCGTCLRWGNHLSADHAEWKQKLKDRRKRNSSGHNHSGIVSPDVSSSTTTQSSPSDVSVSSVPTSSPSTSATVTTPGVNSASVTRIFRLDE
jgi:hypothetical protein